MLEGCKTPLKEYPKEAIFNPIFVFDDHGLIVQSFDSAGNPSVTYDEQTGRATSSLCAEYELTNPQTLEYRHVKDWPIQKCQNIFGFTPSSIQKINNWVRDAIEKTNKRIQELEDQARNSGGNDAVNL